MDADYSYRDLAQNEEMIENIILSSEYEQALILQERPRVLDPGSAFRDEYGILHTDACGWLVIHAALHLLYHLKKLPKKLVQKLIHAELVPGKLKSLSGTYLQDIRITDKNFADISSGLNIEIVIHEPGQSIRTFGQGGDCQIHIYFALSHYYVLVGDEDYLSDFVLEWDELGYKLYNLAECCNPNPYSWDVSDHKLATQLQFEADREYAMSLQDIKQNHKQLQDQLAQLQSQCSWFELGEELLQAYANILEMTYLSPEAVEQNRDDIIEQFTHLYSKRCENSHLITEQCFLNLLINQENCIRYRLKL